jgi:hypothetical protein
MVCSHLRPLEQALQAARITETSRGMAWSQDCREWVYFDIRLDVEALRRRFAFPHCVVVHENTDERSGLEKGFVCEECHDAVMGLVRGGAVFA